MAHAARFVAHVVHFVAHVVHFVAHFGAMSPAETSQLASTADSNLDTACH